jgi:methylase of polypeptide subunit release factors
VRNLLEGDFFAWYLHAWDDRIDGQVGEVLKTLGQYDAATLEDEPELTRDLLKRLYQYLVPRHLRHDLGEYYTPDWLAQRVLNMMDTDKKDRGNPRKRLLDPGCGSGTFLVLAIQAARDHCKRKDIPDADALELILSNIVGIDLNPLAVIAARTNYLLALGDLLEARGGREIEIPVYLADSILTPSRGGDLFTRDKYQVKTTVGVFEIPQACATGKRIAALAEVLDACVEEDAPTEMFMAWVRERVGLNTAEFYTADAALAALYECLADLHRKGLDGLWARIIKNAFAPVFLERFDYVVGNPPWVNWESLPEEYRRETTPLWAKHNLFPQKGFEAILGGSKDDISILMTYVAIDEYLKNGGKLGFVITQSVFKTAGAGQGFRRFQLGDGTPLNVVHVDDMSEIKPFPSVGNRTAVMVLQKGQTINYPVRYTYWRGEESGRARRRSIPEDATLDEVATMTERSYFVAQPVDNQDSTSPWVSGRERALGAIQKVLGDSDYQAREGVNSGGANAIYWVEVIGQRADGLVTISNFTQGSKRKVEQIQTAVEPDLIYPLLRGRDVERWHAKPSIYLLLMHESGEGLDAIPEDKLEKHYPRTYAYFKHFEEIARRRSVYRRYFTENHPFYSMFNVGDYTFAPYKVVWRYIASSFTCAVVSVYQDIMLGCKLVIPDHRTITVPLETAEQAFYLSAVLNSAPSRYLVQSYVIGSQISTHVLRNLRISQFNPTNSTHCQLAFLSQEAHKATEAGDAPQVQEIEAEIDQLAKEFWGLTQQELEDIQQSLEELQ